jgi:hypothetical protein
MRQYDYNVRLVFILLLSVRIGLGCTVVAPSVKGAVKRAEVVFRGSITSITEKEIVFRVERVWKGHVPTTFSMPKITWSGTPCLPGFYERDVQLGAELLVYARRMPEANIPGYVASPGSRTTLAQYATDDIQKLGRGHLPTAGVDPQAGGVP